MKITLDWQGLTEQELNTKYILSKLIGEEITDDTDIPLLTQLCYDSRSVWQNYIIYNEFKFHTIGDYTGMDKQLTDYIQEHRGDIIDDLLKEDNPTIFQKIIKFFK